MLDGCAIAGCLFVHRQAGVVPLSRRAPRRRPARRPRAPFITPCDHSSARVGGRAMRGLRFGCRLERASTLESRPSDRDER